MKKMKLFCGILIGLLILSSCSNDDDSNSVSKSIVGIWKPIKVVDVCSTGSEFVSNYNSCKQTSRLTFNENGSYKETSYYLSGNDCILDYVDNATWEINNGALSINYQGSIESVTFFELSGNILRVGQYDNDPNFPCDGGNLPSHYYTELLRVE